jgi:hypothetical protein
MTTTTKRSIPNVIDTGLVRVTRDEFLALEEIFVSAGLWTVQIAANVLQGLYDKGLVEFGRYGRTPTMTERAYRVFDLRGELEPRKWETRSLVPAIPVWMDQRAAARLLACFA